MDISAKAFLNDQFGSPDGVLAILRKHGLPTPKRQAAEKWFYRNNVPGEWLFVLILALQAEGKVSGINFNTYVEGRKDDVFA